MKFMFSSSFMTRRISTCPVINTRQILSSCYHGNNKRLWIIGSEEVWLVAWRWLLCFITDVRGQLEVHSDRVGKSHYRNSLLQERVIKEHKWALEASVNLKYQHYRISQPGYIFLQKSGVTSKFIIKCVWVIIKDLIQLKL